MWGLLKPKNVSGNISQIIVCSFYCPPSYNKKNKDLLIDHLTVTIQTLRVSYPEAGIIVSGDRNGLSLVKLASIDVSLKQIVQKVTHGSKVLTVVLTDLYRFYNEPEIIPPVGVDDPDDGVPSDHSGVLVCPIIADYTQKPKKITRTVRPIPASAISDIGKVITEETWDFMDPALTTTQLTELYQSYTTNLVNTYCPEKEITFHPND